MSGMDDRLKTFEKKYSLDQEFMFRIEARAAKLFGLWVAERIGLQGDEAKSYAGSVVSANLEESGFDDIKRHVTSTLSGKDVVITDDEMDSKLSELMEEARLQLSSK